MSGGIFGSQNFGEQSGVVLALSRWRPRMLLNILQDTGSPPLPTRRTMWPKMSVVQRLRNLALKPHVNRKQAFAIRGILSQEQWMQR